MPKNFYITFQFMPCIIFNLQFIFKAVFFLLNSSQGCIHLSEYNIFPKSFKVTFQNKHTPANLQHRQQLSHRKFFKLKEVSFRIKPFLHFLVATISGKKVSEQISSHEVSWWTINHKLKQVLSHINKQNNHNTLTVYKEKA